MSPCLVAEEVLLSFSCPYTFSGIRPSQEKRSEVGLVWRNVLLTSGLPFLLSGFSAGAEVPLSEARGEKKGDGQFLGKLRYCSREHVFFPYGEHGFAAFFEDRGCS